MRSTTREGRCSSQHQRNRRIRETENMIKTVQRISMSSALLRLSVWSPSSVSHKGSQCWLVFAQRLREGQEERVDRCGAEDVSIVYRKHMETKTHAHSLGRRDRRSDGRKNHGVNQDRSQR